MCEEYQFKCFEQSYGVNEMTKLLSSKSILLASSIMALTVQPGISAAKLAAPAPNGIKIPEGYKTGN